jgi:hypothetical protein
MRCFASQTSLLHGNGSHRLSQQFPGGKRWTLERLGESTVSIEDDDLSNHLPAFSELHLACALKLALCRRESRHVLLRGRRRFAA